MSSAADPDKGRKGALCMGPLAVGLGREFTAEALYVFFTSCDLITTKKPNQSGATSPRGPALGGQWQPQR